MIEINLLRDIDAKPRFENNLLYVMCYKVHAKEFDSVEDREDDYAILSVYLKRRSQWLHTVIYPYHRKFTCGNASS